jgi:hypothetical protein
VRITNIAHFDFTGDLGARYGGRDFFIPAGESLLTPKTIGEHLAKHLARQILIQKAPIRDAKETDGKGSDRPLWDDAQIEDLMKEIMVEVYQEEKPRVLSEDERMAAKIAELNKAEKEAERERGGNVDASSIVPVEGTTGDIVYKDKAQVIAELNAKGVQFDARASKQKLEDLLRS